MKHLLLLFAILAPLLSSPAFPACSTAYQGKVVINEYNYTNNYIELKVLDPAVLAATNDLDNWSLTLKINSGGGRTTTQDVGSVVGNSSQNTCAATTATYIRIPFAANEMENDAVALLKDGAGNEVDLLRMKQDSHSYPNLTPTCSSWPYDTVLNPDMDSSGPKDIARYPDGTGDWAVSPGTGAGSFETPCTTNNDVAKLTKTVNVTSASPGSSVTYTLSLTNNSGVAGSSIIVTDLLPPGLSYVSSSPAGVYNSVTGKWTIASLAAGATSTLTINATVQQAACPGTSIANSAQLTSGLSIPGGATLPPVSATFNLVCTSTAQGFNAVEAGSLTPDASVASGRLYTKLAGSAFTFDVVALNSSNARDTAFGAKSVSVELVDASTGTCASYASLNPARTQTLNFTDADQGRKTVAAFTVGRAYRKLAVRMSGDGVTACSSDMFAVRPPSFAVSSTANADATGVDVAALPKIPAGTSFTLQAVATAGYDGTPLINSTVSRWQAHGAGAMYVVPEGAFAAADAASGTAAGNAFTYKDVGYFRLAEVGAVEDTGFTAVDQASDCTDDYSNTRVNGKYGCRIGNAAPSDYFGRFVPHHFAVVPAATVTHRAGIAACAASATFTYLGEPLQLSFVLQAQHAGNGITRKYEGSFGKLVLAYPTTVPANLAFNAIAGGTNLKSELDFACTGCGTTGVWSAGAASVAAKFAVKRPGALPLPYYATAASKAVNFGIRPDDGDIDHAQAVYDADMDAAIALSDHLLLKKNATDALTADYLFGRMRLTTIYGSDRQPLTVPVELQVWNGAAFVTASGDSCTPLAAGNVVLSPAGISSVASIKPVASGRGGIVLAAPATPQRSAVRVCADLGAASHVGLADDAACTAASPAALRSLTGPWDGTNGFYGNDPSARAHFGLYGAPYIYYRER